MTGPMTVSERDLRALAGIVTADRADLPAQGLPISLLGDLMSQIRCDIISFEGFDSEHETTWFGQAVPTDVNTVDEAFEPVHWRHYWDCQPCSYPDRTGDLRSVIKITDFYSTRQWHSTGMYCDLYRPKGVEHELMLSLPAGPVRPPGPGRTLRMFLFRESGSDFSEADRALLTLLRPHLYQACLDAERRRHPSADLTFRQRQLLDLVAAGYTNAQIARRLGIAEGTVRKHMENIHRRLQVPSRTAAVTRALPHPGLAAGR
ncbi:MAG: response regulator transcription factor [Streptosporangiaceae bacterium]|nr:response regulator transcription factor [Streptosporangiaceae bacterium]MBV9853638.1 response regulator transcription factor [Streptosporangiaceae bacterium]